MTGGKPSIFDYVDTVYYFDTENWTTFPIMRYKRAEHGCALTRLPEFGVGVIVAGGRTQGHAPLSSVEFLPVNLDSGQPGARWERLPDLQYPRYYYPAVGNLDAQTLVVAGGYEGGAGNPDSVERFNEEQWRWSVVEKWELSGNKYNFATVFLPRKYTGC